LFLVKSFIFRGRIGADTEHNGVFCVELIDPLPESSCFEGSTRCSSPQIEPQDDFPACIILQTMAMTRLVRKIKIRGGNALF
jgi:hypothetical protein